jgi:transcriptional regulator with GAF, ATPase, and Fis domain
MAQELLEVHPVNGFHQGVESKSTIYLNGAGSDHAHAHARLIRPKAFSSIVHASRAMAEIVNKIERERDSDTTILITGETGTGKELIARVVHDLSSRHERVFIPFNCGGGPRELIASWLFGHQRGSFTGADRNVKGVVREADGGTLLLDEIGDLSLDLQALLLRPLQEGEVHPLGAPKPIKTDVRLIAATNRDLEADIQSGRFREDLYWRLNVSRIHIPPLRERREDIPLLIEHFLARRQQETGKQGLWLSDEAWALMSDYHWPGNVRQVKNVIYRLVASAENGELIGRESALDAVRTGTCAPPPASAVIILGEEMIDPLLPHYEAKDKLLRLQIEYALKRTGGNLSQAAEGLKMSLPGMKKAIKRLGIKAQASASIVVSGANWR